jgi:hypothetical protein
MYSNLWLCQQEMKGERDNPLAPQVIASNDYLLQAMIQVDALVETHCEQDFAPRIVSYTLDVEPNTVDTYTNQLLLKRPYLTITSLKVDGVTLVAWDGDSSTRDDADYHPTPRRGTPFYVLQGMQDSVWIPDSERRFVDAIEVEGITGYRKNYHAEGWQNSGDTVQNNPLTLSGQSLTVTNAGASQFGTNAPRFSEGDLLRAESEFMRVWAVSSNTLTVERGVRGSTAVQHVQGTVIEVWQAEPQVVRAATKWAVYMAKRRAQYDTLKLNAGAAGQVTISTPARMPEETEMILDRLKNPSNKLMGV